MYEYLSVEQLQYWPYDRLKEYRESLEERLGRLTTFLAQVQEIEEVVRVCENK